ncbi:VOC family protein [Aquamicrobium segne]|uniref:VOC family protein n=1 Tax=Aquamicrobium segne TaxID=469547 RepID=A0ABW0H3Q8_9HYPH
MTSAVNFFDMNAAPMRIGTVRLKVRDLETVSGFYQKTLGLSEISNSPQEAVLGVGATPLLILAADPALAPRDRRQAGLFHTAFLMPTRADLGRWVGYIAEMRLRIDGASDHIVSEALYLTDPEGNGIEVYADRPVADWLDKAGRVQMSTDPLDLRDLAMAAEGRVWAGFPDGGSIGHVHLQVGDTVLADRFYNDVLGFDKVVDYPGASFYGSGGYHHQLAGNIWNSRGASRRPENMAGLNQVEIIMRDADDLATIIARAEDAGIEIARHDQGATLHDPWGTAITLKF